MFLTLHACVVQAMAMVPLRDSALQDELNKQNSNDTLRAKFATQANAVGAYIHEKMEVMGWTGDLSSVCSLTL